MWGSIAKTLAACLPTHGAAPSLPHTTNDACRLKGVVGAVTDEQVKRLTTDAKAGMRRSLAAIDVPSNSLSVEHLQFMWRSCFELPLNH